MNTTVNKHNEAYLAHVETEKIIATRWLCLLAFFMYALFAMADFYSLSVTLKEVFLIRGSVVAVILLGMLATFVLPEFVIKYYDFLLAPMFLITAAGIEAMIYLSVPGDHAFNVYFAGLLLIIMSIFSWSYLGPGISMSVSSAIVIAYLAIGADKGMEVQHLMVNIFFVLGAGIIGFFSQLVRDRYMEENFYLQQSLQQALEEKIVEAKDNAYLANHDALTELPNRRYITELLEESLEIAKEKDKVLAILFFDLNGFKQVNDIYGHAVGDEVLVIVAKRLELAIRRGDYVSRLGGDEYLIGLMVDKTRVSEIQNMADKFTAIVSKPMHIDGNIVKVGTSIGIAAYPMHGNKVEVLIDIADKKMYKVKQVSHDRDGESKSDEGEKAVVIFPGNSKNAS